MISLQIQIGFVSTPEMKNAVGREIESRKVIVGIIRMSHDDVHTARSISSIMIVSCQIILNSKNIEQILSLNNDGHSGFHEFSSL